VKLLVSGGRNYADAAKLNAALDKFMSIYGRPEKLIVGDARGADTLARLWAQRNGIPVEVYKADWDKYGKSAGPIRNQRMVNEGHPDRALLFAGGKGTGDMAERLNTMGHRIPYERVR
jgi:hypothetical protein